MAKCRNKPGQGIQEVSRRPWQLWPLALSGFVVVLSLAVLAVMNGVVSLTDLVGLRERWDALQPSLLIWRLGLIIALVAGWPHWVSRLARRQGWPPAQQAAAIRLRWQVAGWLVLMELLIGQDGMVALMQWLIIGQG